VRLVGAPCAGVKVRSAVTVTLPALCSRAADLPDGRTVRDIGPAAFTRFAILQLVRHLDGRTAAGELARHPQRVAEL
jgi:hypothetical protein